MKIDRICAFALMIIACISVLGIEVEESDRVFLFAPISCRGCQFMSLKGVPEGRQIQNVSHWEIPAQIQIGTKTYRVEGTGGFSLFDVSSTNATAYASGYFGRFSSAYRARVCACAEISMGSAEMSYYVSHTEMQVLDAGTNTLYLTRGDNNLDGLGMLVFNNMYIALRGTTNKLEIALAIRDAGLEMPSTRR